MKFALSDMNIFGDEKIYLKNYLQTMCNYDNIHPTLREVN